MDGALSSSRKDEDNNRSYHHQRNRDYNDNRQPSRGGGRGGYNHRGRGGGRSYHHHNNDGRRYHPYQNRRRGGGGGHRGGGRGGGNRQPNNRFENKETTSVDPQAAMLKQLTAMVAKMGDLIECAKNADVLVMTPSTDDKIKVEDDSDGNEKNHISSRAVVQAVAKNIQDLVAVVCKPANAPMFLKYTPPAETAGMVSTTEEGSQKRVINAEEEAGPMATLVTSCAATLPLQSPSYTGLTLGIEEHAPDALEGATGEITSFKGFSQRCITMATRRLSSDLDKMCGVTFLLDSGLESFSETSSGDEQASPTENFVDAFQRCKLLLRYFSLLAKAGIVLGYDENEDTADDDNQISMNNEGPSRLSIAGLLKVLTIAAVKVYEASLLESHSKAACQSFMNISVLLCTLILSTIPYTMEYIPKEFMDFIWMKIEYIMKQYKSTYQPGSGIMTILLQKEIHEETFLKIDSDDDDEDEEEDDDEDEDDSNPPCADTLQDLYRTVQKVLASFHGTNTTVTRYSLLVDSPWVCLKGKEQEYAPMEGDEEDAMKDQQSQASQLKYSGEAINISFEGNILLPYLFSLDGNSSGNDVMVNGVSISTTVALQCPTLEGIIFGRISIFDPPPSDDDDDEDEEEKPENPHVEAYVKNFSLPDRFFLSEAVRDCLVCHKSSVNHAGLEKGSCKDVAEQIWGVCHLFQSATNSSDLPMESEQGIDNQVASIEKGVEYGIIETMLSLIVQSPRHVDSSSPLSHIYLSRVLIELTKFQPSLIPQCLVVAVAALFNDFLPSMSPLAKENLSQWLSFHLTNTDYQWPQAYWNAWTPFVTKGMASSEGQSKRNCRGEFVVSTLQFMGSNLSNPEALLKGLPMNSELCDYIMGTPRATVVTKSSALEDTQLDLTDRIWIRSDDPDMIRDYITGDEIAESVQSDIDPGQNTDSDNMWWRTGLVVRSLLRPASRDNQKLESLIKEMQGIEMGMYNEPDPKEDVVTDIGDILPRYKTVILAAIAQDIRIQEENLDLQGETKKSESDMILSGEIFVLRQCESVLSYSTVILKSCIEVLVSNEVVSPKSVICWSIGGYEPETHLLNPIASGWWNFASSAVHIGLNKSMSHSGASGDMLSSDVGMIIDTGGDGDDDAKAATPSIRRMNSAIDYIKPLLRFTSHRIQKYFESTDLAETMTHEKADLSEGLKFFSRSLASHVKATLKEDEIVKATTELGGSCLEVETFFANSEM